MKVPVILLNYNSSTDCRKCVSFLKRQKGVELEIIIVDNDSPREGEKTAVEQLCREQGCTFLQAEDNRGYNAGNNVGLRYAAKQGYKYAVIANPDMEFPQTNYFAKLTTKMEEDPQIAVCGTNIVDIHGERQSPKRYTSYFEETFWFLNGLYELINKHRTLILDPCNQYCDMIMGSCIMVRMDFIKSIHFFDENVFLYCEEPILGKQVASKHMRVYYLHEITAVHAHIENAKGSFVKRHDIYWQSRKYYLTHYSGYNKSMLYIMMLSKKMLYIYKWLSFKINRIK